MKNAGDDSFITVLEFNGISKLAQAIKQIGWVPKAPYYGAQAYGPQVPQLAGDAANGALIGLTHDIVEGGGADMSTFAQFYQASSSGQALDFFAIMGWTAAKLCVDAIAAAGPAPTRDSVIAELNKITSYTAGTILAPRDPAGKAQPDAVRHRDHRGRRVEARLPGRGLRRPMSKAVDWFVGIREKPTRGIAVVLVLFYVVRVWTTAGDVGAALQLHDDRHRRGLPLSRSPRAGSCSRTRRPASSTSPTAPSEWSRATSTTRSPCSTAFPPRSACSSFSSSSLRSSGSGPNE